MPASDDSGPRSPACRTNLSKITSSASSSSSIAVQSIDRIAELAKKSQTEQLAGGLLCRPPVRQGRLNLPASGLRQTNAIDPLGSGVRCRHQAPPDQQLEISGERGLLNLKKTAKLRRAGLF